METVRSISPVILKPDTGTQIRKLDPAVVNRIAAGEIVQRPANALKELIENSIDAGASTIKVVIQSGGLKHLQVQDNGHGIAESDFDILCERFTTSKLTQFSDLLSLQTFGFRGEALASISHISKLTVVSRTKSTAYACKGYYYDGKLSKGLTRCAGNVGTNVVAENLFYNMPLRQKSIQSAADETSKIIDIVTKYAVHNHKISFCLKKVGETLATIHTTAYSDVASTVANLYGSAIGRELIQVDLSDSLYKFRCQAVISNPNFSLKKPTFLFFINNRLVECSSLRHSVESIYSPLLPKHCHPFVYLSLKILPLNIDVNVHPTKHEVRFLYEQEIIQKIHESILERLLECEESRTFYTRSLNPSCIQAGDDVAASVVAVKRDLPSSESSSTVVAPPPSKQIRVDHSNQKLEAFFGVTRAVELPVREDPRLPNIFTSSSSTEDVPNTLYKDVPNTLYKETAAQCESEITAVPSSSSIDVQLKNLPRKIELTSVLDLRSEFRARSLLHLREVIRKHIFISVLPPPHHFYLLIQHEISLYLVNSTRIIEEFFYQLVLLRFGNFPLFKLTSPVSIFDLAFFALENNNIDKSLIEDGNSADNELLAQLVVKKLRPRYEMLDDYFSFQFDSKTDCISGLPVILESYAPNMERFPLFILQLATETCWDTEKECFQTVCRQLAKFYSFIPSSTKKDGQQPSTTAAVTSRRNEIIKTENWTMEHVVLKAMRNILHPPKDMLNDGTFLKLTSLTDLYKVFERC